MKRKEQKWNNSFLIFLCIWESWPPYLFMFYIFRKSALLMLLNVWGKQIFRPIIGSLWPCLPHRKAKSRSVLTRASLMTSSTLKRMRRRMILMRTRAYFHRQENQNLVIWPEPVHGRRRSTKLKIKSWGGPSVEASQVQNLLELPRWTPAGSDSASSSSATSASRRRRRSWSASCLIILAWDWTWSQGGCVSAAKMSDSGCSTGLTAVSYAVEM